MKYGTFYKLGMNQHLNQFIKFLSNVAEYRGEKYDKDVSRYRAKGFK